MSEKMRRALECAVKSVELNTPQVEEKLSWDDIKANPALVYSAAKYFQALEKLSNE
jgi:hypothetical protein